MDVWNRVSVPEIESLLLKLLNSGMLDSSLGQVASGSPPYLKSRRPQPTAPVQQNFFKGISMLNRCKLFAISVFLLSAATANAQTFRGEIKGLVQDGSGAVISEAVVQAVHTGTGFTRSTL